MPKKNKKRHYLFSILICLTLVTTTRCEKSFDSTSESDSLASTNATSTSAASITTTTAATGQFTLVDTNQSICYTNTGSIRGCSGSGQDGEYSGNAPSYSLNGSVVTDNITGLEWAQSTDTNGDGKIDSADQKSPADAATYCDSLTLGGQSDWRLPDIKTLYSLILFSGKDASGYSGSDTSTLTLFIDSIFDAAYGDTSAGDRLIDAQYASSTIYVSTTFNNDVTMFGVNFVDGRIKGYPVIGKTYYVRCVRGNTEYGLNNFKNNNDGTISDLATGLMWQEDDSASVGWGNAVNTCNNATSAGYSDWRLPNAKELQSIIDYSRSPDTSSSAALNSIFNATTITNEENETDWGWYWASTTHVDYLDGASNAVYLAFGRALGYSSSVMYDVHGAGAQRSNDKDSETDDKDGSADLGNGLFHYHGPQGDILRIDNMVRCVRDI